MLRSALGKILSVNLPMPEVDANLLTGGEPIRARNSFALCGTPDPGPNQFIPVCVPVHILEVIIEAGVTGCKINRTGEATFQSQVEFGQLRYLSEVQATLPN